MEKKSAFIPPVSEVIILNTTSVMCASYNDIVMFEDEQDSDALNW